MNTQDNTPTPSNGAVTNGAPTNGAPSNGAPAPSNVAAVVPAPQSPMSDASAPEVVDGVPVPVGCVRHKLDEKDLHAVTRAIDKIKEEQRHLGSLRQQYLAEEMATLERIGAANDSYHMLVRTLGDRYASPNADDRTSVQLLLMHKLGEFWEVPASTSQGEQK